MKNRVRLRLDFQVEHVNLNLYTMMAKMDVHSFSTSKQNTLPLFTNTSLKFGLIYMTKKHIRHLAFI